MATAQQQNADLVELLSVYFVENDNPSYALGQAISNILALPALRAFWPMSNIDYVAATRVEDLGGAGFDLADNNTVTFGYDQLAPYAAFDGVNQYLSRADGGAANWADITGTEAYIVAAQRGLTLGGWFYVTADTASMVFIGKVSAAGANRAYTLSWITATQFPRFRIGSGAVDYTVDGTAGTTGTAPPGVWHFYAARFIPSTEIKVYLNAESNVNVAAIPAAINDVAAQFTIGATGVPGNYLNGRASMCFLCAAALSDSIISALYHNTRKLYNV